MENENVIGKVCFAILRKGFVAGLRISLELDSPGCIIGCKFDGAGIVGNTVIDDSDILLHITSHGIQTEKGHTTGDRSVFYIGVGAALKLSGRRKIENVSRAAGACAHFEPVGCLYITGCFQRKKRCCGDFRIMQRCGRLLCGGTFVVACPRIGRCACKQIGGDGNLYRCGGEIGNCTVAKVCIRTEATALGRVLSALLLGNNQTITQKLLDVLNRRNPFYQIRLLIQGECFRQILVRSVIQRIVQIQKLSVAGFVIGTQTTTSQIVGTHSDPCLIRIPDDENLRMVCLSKCAIMDYIEFVAELCEFVYANERDHVQKIVEQHYWLFGEQYHLVTADKRMQKALEEYLYLLYGDKAPNPVLTPDEEELRRMDIFACAARNTEDANGSAIQENLVVELKAPKVVLTKAVLRQIEDYMDYVRKQPLFNSQYRRWKFIAVCSAVDDDVKARYDSQKSKGKKGLVAEIDNYEVYALTWDDVFQSFDLRHAFLLDKLKMDKEAIAAEIAQTAGDEKSKDTADALTALVAN